MSTSTTAGASGQLGPAAATSRRAVHHASTSRRRRRARRASTARAPGAAPAAPALGRGDQHAHVAVGEDVRDLPGLQHRVDRARTRRRPAEVPNSADDRLDALVEVDRHPLAPPQPEPVQRRARTRRPWLPQLGVVDRRVVRTSAPARRAWRLAASETSWWKCVRIRGCSSSRRSPGHGSPARCTGRRRRRPEAGAAEHLRRRRRQRDAGAGAGPRRASLQPAWPPRRGAASR